MIVEPLPIFSTTIYNTAIYINMRYWSPCQCAILESLSVYNTGILMINNICFILSLCLVSSVSNTNTWAFFRSFVSLDKIVHLFFLERIYFYHLWQTIRSVLLSSSVCLFCIWHSLCIWSVLWYHIYGIYLLLHPIH